MEIHRVGHACIDLHPPGLVSLFCCGQLVPVSRRAHRLHRHVLGHQTQRGSLVATLLAQHRPAVLVTALVFGDELGRSLHRDMVGLKCDIGEKRLAACLARLDVIDRLVDIELRRVILGWHDRLMPVFEPVDLVGQVEVALAGFPVVRTAVAHHDRAIETMRRRQVVGFLANMPFAGGISAVTAIAQAGGHGHDIGVQDTQITGLTHMRLRNRLAHIADAVAVVVDPGQQHRTRRRTGSADMEVRKSHAAPRQFIQIWRLDLAAKCADIAETPVVGEQHDDIRSWLRGGLGRT